MNKCFSVHAKYSKWYQIAHMVSEIKLTTTHSGIWELGHSMYRPGCTPTSSHRPACSQGHNRRSHLNHVQSYPSPNQMVSPLHHNSLQGQTRRAVQYLTTRSTTFDPAIKDIHWLMSKTAICGPVIRGLCREVAALYVVVHRQQCFSDISVLLGSREAGCFREAAALHSDRYRPVQL